MQEGKAKRIIAFDHALPQCGLRELSGRFFGIPAVDHLLLHMVQLAMEEMIGAGNHDHGQVLRTCPVEHIGQGDCVIQFAVDHQRVGRHRRQRPFAGGRADQRQPLRRRGGHLR